MLNSHEVHPEIRLHLLRKYMAAYIEHIYYREKNKSWIRDVDPLMSLAKAMTLALFPTFDEWVEWHVAAGLKPSVQFY